MNRTHIFMLACISIFTGMIAPSVGNTDIIRPYALTNMQYVAYGIFASIIFLFLFSNFRLRYIAEFFAGILILLILSLGMMSIAGLVQDFSGITLQKIKWGWIFLGVGVILLVWALLKKDKDIKKIHNLGNMYEKIIGILGFFILSILTTFVIIVAEINANKSQDTSHLGKNLDKEISIHFSGSIISKPFENIEHFAFHRKQDLISFVGYNSGSNAVFYPSDIKLQSLETIRNIIQLQGKTYFIKDDNSVIENGEKIGITNQEIFDNFLAYEDSEGKQNIITETTNNTYNTYSGSFGSIDKYLFKPNTNDIYWRDTKPNGQTIFKNGIAVSETYPTILRFAVSIDGYLSLVTEEKTGAKVIVKDGKIAHFIKPEYISGTLRMNGNDSLYVIQNPDDNSFSIVFNGNILDKRFDEIREVFLEKNSSGFAYFGRPQGETKYCIFTRYKGHLCGLSGYMNPTVEADGVGIIFAGLRDNKWQIYRNIYPFIGNISYMPQGDISNNYFFFDPTHPQYYILVQKVDDEYIIHKQNKKIAGKWKDFKPETVKFGYDSKVFVVVEDEKGWRILEN